MNPKFQSLLTGLTDYVPYQNRDLFIEARAQQVLASIENLKKLIDETYEPELAEELTKRLLNAAKSGDEKKFTRKITEIRKGKSDGSQK